MHTQPYGMPLHKTYVHMTLWHAYVHRPRYTWLYDMYVHTDLCAHGSVPIPIVLDRMQIRVKDLQAT